MCPLPINAMQGPDNQPEVVEGPGLRPRVEFGAGRCDALLYKGPVCSLGAVAPARMPAYI